MSTSMSKYGFALIGATVLLLQGLPAEAGKPGGGGTTTDPCLAPDLQFPAFTSVVRSYSKSAGYQNQVRLSDVKGACTVLVETVPGDSIAPILIELSSGWRLVWSNAQVGITVLDFAVNFAAGQPPVVAPLQTTSINLAGQRASSIDEMPDGGFVYLIRPLTGSPATIWRATWSEGSQTWATTALADADSSVMALIDIATPPDGSAVYYIYATNDSFVARLPLGNLPDPGQLPVRIGGQDDPSELIATWTRTLGGTQYIAAGTCDGIAGRTCLAIELHGPNTDPCVPHYYRTLVWDTADAPVNETYLAALPKLQIAAASFTSSGELLGQLTGSTSKRSCTAKIYDTMIRLSPFNPDTVTTLGTGQAPDAPF